MFKSIKGYEGKYSVNEMGEVRNDKTGRILKQTNNLNNYLMVSLSKDGDVKIKYIHRLVAETHLEPDDKRNEVDHIDGDRLNNNLSNLRWVTRSENLHNVKNAKGYCWYKRANKWQAYICVNGKAKHLGYYPTEEEARQAYLNSKKIYHPSSPIK
jgi:hypothetical protein